MTAHSDLPACAGCGACCHLVVELRPDDHVPPEMVTGHDGVRCMEQRGNGACVALDPVTRLCTIYGRRPQTCRDFNRGDGVCLWVLDRLKENAARRAPAVAV
ncbi:MAG: YkgJ family cysteine cluster protein [Opitutales bacterium]